MAYKTYLTYFLSHPYIISYRFPPLSTWVIVLQSYWPPCSSFSVPNYPVSGAFAYFILSACYPFPQIPTWFNLSLTSFRYMLKYLNRKLFPNSLYKITVPSSLSLLSNSFTLLCFFHGNKYYLFTYLRVYDVYFPCIDCTAVPYGQRPIFIHCYIPSI